jgi:hypothetical protein
MMKAGPHTNPAAPARHRPPSPPRGNDRKALQLSATSPLREEAIAGTPNLDAAVSSSRTRDDRVLSGTRVAVYVIVSFLVLAFAVLYR